MEGHEAYDFSFLVNAPVASETPKPTLVNGRLGDEELLEQMLLGVREEDTATVVEQSWTPSEQAAFTLGIFFYGRDFAAVARLIGTRREGEAAAFYYQFFKYAEPNYARWKEIQRGQYDNTDARPDERLAAWQAVLLRDALQQPGALDKLLEGIELELERMSRAAVAAFESGLMSAAALFNLLLSATSSHRLVDMVDMANMGVMQTDYYTCERRHRDDVAAGVPMPDVAPAGRPPPRERLARKRSGWLSAAPLEPKVCANCGTSNTPLWRREAGVNMCNACGIYYKNHQQHRPKELIGAVRRTPPSSRAATPPTSRPGTPPRARVPSSRQRGVSRGADSGSERSTPPPRSRRNTPQPPGSPYRTTVSSVHHPPHVHHTSQQYHPSQYPSASLYELPSHAPPSPLAHSSALHHLGSASHLLHHMPPSPAYQWLPAGSPLRPSTVPPMAPRSPRRPAPAAAAASSALAAGSACDGGAAMSDAAVSEMSEPAGPDASRLSGRKRQAGLDRNYSFGRGWTVYEEEEEVAAPSESAAKRGGGDANGRMGAAAMSEGDVHSGNEEVDAQLRGGDVPSLLAAAAAAVAAATSAVGPSATDDAARPAVSSTPERQDAPPSPAPRTTSSRMALSGAGQRDGQEVTCPPSASGGAVQQYRNNAGGSDVSAVTDLTVADDSRQVAAVLVSLKCDAMFPPEVNQDIQTSIPPDAGLALPEEDDGEAQQRRSPRAAVKMEVDGSPSSSDSEAGHPATAVPRRRRTSTSMTPPHRSRSRRTPSSTPPRSAGSRGRTPSEGRPGVVCANCGTSKTPLWRRDKETGETMCNACGIYKQTHNYARPVDHRPSPEPHHHHHLSVSTLPGDAIGRAGTPHHVAPSKAPTPPPQAHSGTSSQNSPQVSLQHGGALSGLSGRPPLPPPRPAAPALSGGGGSAAAGRPPLAPVITPHERPPKAPPLVTPHRRGTAPPLITVVKHEQPRAPVVAMRAGSPQQPEDLFAQWNKVARAGTPPIAGMPEVVYGQPVMGYGPYVQCQQAALQMEQLQRYYPADPRFVDMAMAQQAAAAEKYAKHEQYIKEQYAKQQMAPVALHGAAPWWQQQPLPKRSPPPQQATLSSDAASISLGSPAPPPPAFGHPDLPSGTAFVQSMPSAARVAPLSPPPPSHHSPPPSSSAPGPTPTKTTVTTPYLPASGSPPVDDTGGSYGGGGDVGAGALAESAPAPARSSPPSPLWQQSPMSSSPLLTRPVSYQTVTTAPALVAHGTLGHQAGSQQQQQMAAAHMASQQLQQQHMMMMEGMMGGGGGSSTANANLPVYTVPRQPVRRHPHHGFGGPYELTGQALDLPMSMHPVSGSSGSGGPSVVESRVLSPRLSSQQASPLSGLAAGGLESALEIGGATEVQQHKQQQAMQQQQSLGDGQLQQQQQMQHHYAEVQQQQRQQQAFGEAAWPLMEQHPMASYIRPLAQHASAGAAGGGSYLLPPSLVLAVQQDTAGSMDLSGESSHLAPTQLRAASPLPLEGRRNV